MNFILFKIFNECFISKLSYFDELKASKITLGVFENNISAIHCYLLCDFQIVEGEAAESYQFMGEIWKRIEMEVIR